MSLTTNEIEAANRAEATALLIRAGYRVYRPEADAYGEDLILRDLNGQLKAVQLKSRPLVDRGLYGGKNIWMLFPDPKGVIPGRDWYLIPHDGLFAHMQQEHGNTASMSKKEAWSDSYISKKLQAVLDPYRLPTSVPTVAETS
jgi:hypothetical protein